MPHLQRFANFEVKKIFSGNNGNFLHRQKNRPHTAVENQAFMANLLQVAVPISDAAPCGADLAESGKLQELEHLAVPAYVTTNGGKRIPDDDSRREPDWTGIETRSRALLKDAHDLRVAGFNAAAKLRTAGLPGLAEGLQLMAQMLETWGAKAHPTVDTTSPASVRERLQALASIAAPYKRDGDLLRVVEGVRTAPLTTASTTEFNQAYLLANRQKDGSQDAVAVQSFKQAWTHEPKAKRRAIVDAISSSLTSLESMTNWIRLNLPDSMMPSTTDTNSMAPLVAELQNIRQTIALAGEGAESPAAGQGAGTLPSEPSPAGETTALTSPSIPLNIQSRADAIRILGQVRDYFKATEPTSPSIFFIDRACSLVGKNFRDALAELMPESAAKFEELLGMPNSKNNKS